MHRYFQWTYLIVVIGVLCGCAASTLHRDGLRMIANGHPDEGLAKLSSAVELAPTNAVFRADLITQRDRQFERLLKQGKAAADDAQWQQARSLLDYAREVSPLDPRAADAIQLLAHAQEVSTQIDKARIAFGHGDIEDARDLAAQALSVDPNNSKGRDLLQEIESRRARDQIERPVLRSLRGNSVSLHFTDASVKMIFEAIGRLSGLAIVQDQDIKPDVIASVSVDDVPAGDAIRFVSQTAHLRVKVLDSKTVFVYPSTADKIRDYEELIVKGFYLSDGDVRRTEALLKGFLKTEDLFVDEKKNLLIIRGSADTIAIAEKLVALDDVTQPEVMLEVQVMEVNRSRLTNLGIQYPNQATLSRQPSSGSATTLLDYKKIAPSVIGLVIPNTIINLNQVFTDADILANPRIRVKNREHAAILIGDKLPVVTSTATSTGFVSENVQYLDVGLKLNVEPDISLDQSVSINMSLEVSSVVNQITTPGGSLAYDIGTRNASTVLELKDGETEVLAGLISDNDTRTSNNIPGLGQFPIVGRLFSSRKTDHEKSEIILLITPHIVRGYRPTVARDNQFWSGTASSPHVEPLVLHHGKDIAAQRSDSTNLASPAAPNLAADSTPPAASPPAVIAWSGLSNVKAGDVFKMSLHVSSAAAIHSFPFEVLYDTDSLEVLQVQEGGYFNGAGGQSLFAASSQPEAGNIVVNAGAPGNVGAKSDGYLAILLVRAKKPAPAAHFQVSKPKPLDDQGQLVPVSGDADFRISITAP